MSENIDSKATKITADCDIHPASGYWDCIPTSCPMVTRNFKLNIMRRCRFGERLLRQLISDDLVPINGGCPFIRSCRLLCLITAKQEEEQWLHILHLFHHTWFSYFSWSTLQGTQISVFIKLRHVLITNNNDTLFLSSAMILEAERFAVQRWGKI